MEAAKKDTEESPGGELIKLTPYAESVNVVINKAKLPQDVASIHISWKMTQVQKQEGKMEEVKEGEMRILVDPERTGRKRVIIAGLQPHTTYIFRVWLESKGWLSALKGYIMGDEKGGAFHKEVETRYKYVTPSLIESEEERKAFIKRKLTDYHPPIKDERFSALVVGPADSGKSTLINSLISTALGTLVSLCRVAYNDRIGTTAIEEIAPRETNIEEVERAFGPVRFIDSWGPEVQVKEIYSEFAATALLQGRVPNLTPKCNIDENSIVLRTDIRITHCLIVVLRAMDVNDSQSLACVRPFVRLADDMGIGVLAVITKIDEYDPALATKPTEVYKNERLHHKVREAAATNLCLQLMNVLCVKNYVAESSTTPQIDQLMIEVWKAILRLSLDTLTRQAIGLTSRGSKRKLELPVLDADVPNVNPTQQEQREEDGPPTPEVKIEQHEPALKRTRFEEGAPAAEEHN